MPSRTDRLAFLDREILFWSAALALDERGAECCRTRLAEIEAERTALVQQQASRAHILPRSAGLRERLGAATH